MNNCVYNINDDSPLILCLINEIKRNGINIQSNRNNIIKAFQNESNAIEFVQYIKREIDLNTITDIDMNILEYAIDNNCYFVIRNVATSTFLDSFIKLILSYRNNNSISNKALYLLDKWANKYPKNYRGVYPYPEFIKYKNIVQMKGISFMESNTTLSSNNNNILDINAIDDGFNVESCDNGNDSETRDRIINDWVDLLKKVNYMIDSNILNKVDIKHDNEIEGLIKKIHKDKPLIQVYIRNSYSNQQSLDLFLCLENDIKVTLNRYEQYVLGNKEIIPFKSSLYSQYNINLVYSPPIQHSKNTLHMKLNNAGQKINNNIHHIGNSLSNHISSAYGYIKNKINSSSNDTQS